MSKAKGQQSSPLSRSRSLNSLVNEQDNEAGKPSANNKREAASPIEDRDSKRFRATEQGPGQGQPKTLSFNIPRNPYIWTENDVGQWLQWVSHHFGLPEITLDRFKISGKELCDLRLEEFNQRTNEYMGDIVYEYLCKFKEGCALQSKLGQSEEALKQLGGLYSPKDALNLAALQRNVRLQDGSQVASPTNNSQSLLPALIQNSGLQGYYTGGPTLAAWPPYNLAISPVYTNAQTSLCGSKDADLHAALLQEKGGTSVTSPLLSQALESFSQAVGSKNGVKPDSKTPARGRGRGSGRGRKAASMGRGKKLINMAGGGGEAGQVEAMDSSGGPHGAGGHTEVTKLTPADQVNVWSSNPVLTDIQTMETLGSPGKTGSELALLHSESPLGMGKGSPMPLTPVGGQTAATVAMMKRIPAKDIQKTLEFMRPGNPPTFDMSSDLTSLLVNLMAVLHDKMKGSQDTIARIQGVPTSDDTAHYQQRTGSPELWSFLLDLLTEEKHYPVIRWVNRRGEFVLLNKEDVSALWGKAKNKDDMNYDKLSRALRYYYESKYKAFKNFGIMQKGEEASIKYNYRFTEAGLAKLCHHIGWDHVRRFTPAESIKGLEQLQNVYLQKMKSPNPKANIAAVVKLPQAQKVLPAEVAGTIPNLLINSLGENKDLEGGEVGATATSTSGGEHSISTPNLLSEAQVLEAATTASSSLPLLLNINPAILQGMLQGVASSGATSSGLMPPMSPATLQAIANLYSTTNHSPSVSGIAPATTQEEAANLKPEDMVTLPIADSPSSPSQPTVGEA